MKRPHRLAFAALLGVPLTLFFAARRASQERPHVLGTHRGCLYLAFSPDGHMLLSTTGSPSRTNAPTILWNLQNGQQYRLTNQPNSVKGLKVFSHDSKYIASVETTYSHSSQGEVFSSPVVLISTRTGQIMKRHMGLQPQRTTFEEARAISAAWSADEKELVVMAPHHIRRISSQQGHGLAQFVYRTFNLNAWDTTALSPDGTLAAYTDVTAKLDPGAQNGSRVILVDTRTGQRRASIPIFSTISHLTFSPQSKFIAADSGPQIEFASLKEGKVLWRWSGLNPTQRAFHFASDEKSVVLCNGSACIARDTQNGHELWRLKNANSPTFALSPDGKTLAEAKPNGQILLWAVPQNS